MFSGSNKDQQVLYSERLPKGHQKQNIILDDGLFLKSPSSFAQQTLEVNDASYKRSRARAHADFKAKN